MQPRGIDHLVFAVHDLDAAGHFYEKLGFRVGARNRHPWGTENRIVQFPHIFLELITIGDNAEIVPHQGTVFSFGAFIKGYLAKREGFAMLVLASDNAERDRDDFAKNGIGGFAPFDFKRQGQRPDGSAVTVAFSLAFARDIQAPQIGYFVCQHHFPENFWNETAQSHPNHAKALTDIALYADNPSDHAEFMSHFTGLRDYSATSTSISFATRGAIHLYTKPAFTYFYGAHDLPEKAQLAAFTVSVENLDALRSQLVEAAIPFHEINGSLIVPAHAAYGTAIRFTALV